MKNDHLQSEITTVNTLSQSQFKQFFFTHWYKMSHIKWDYVTNLKQLSKVKQHKRERFVNSSGAEILEYITICHLTKNDDY